MNDRPSGQWDVNILSLRDLAVQGPAARLIDLYKSSCSSCLKKLCGLGKVGSF